MFGYQSVACYACNFGWTWLDATDTRYRSNQKTFYCPSCAKPQAFVAPAPKFDPNPATIANLRSQLYEQQKTINSIGEGYLLRYGKVLRLCLKCGARQPEGSKDRRGADLWLKQRHQCKIMEADHAKS